MNLGEREIGRETERGDERTAANNMTPFNSIFTIRDLSVAVYSVEYVGDSVNVKALREKAVSFLAEKCRVSREMVGGNKGFCL